MKFACSVNQVSLKEFVDTAIGQLVSPLVARIAAVSFDPTPVHVMLFVGLIEALPKIRIRDRLFGRCLPAPSLLIINPLGNAFHDIGGIRVQRYRTALAEGA